MEISKDTKLFVNDIISFSGNRIEIDSDMIVITDYRNRANIPCKMLYLVKEITDLKQNQVAVISPIRYKDICLSKSGINLKTLEWNPIHWYLNIDLNEICRYSDDITIFKVDKIYRHSGSYTSDVFYHSDEDEEEVMVYSKPIPCKKIKSITKTQSDIDPYDLMFPYSFNKNFVVTIAFIGLMIGAL